MALSDEAISQYFADTYTEGRALFLSACKKAGLAVKSHVHPSLKGPEGEDLAMDVTWIGPKDAGRVMIFSCGTHGLEAAAGSATMLRWLDTGGPGRIPEGMAVLLVHAVNPYGWAWARRGNENGIDLNRNFLVQAPPFPANPAYSDIHPLLLKTHVDEQGLSEFVQSFYKLAATKGLNHALTGVTSGQYDYADGLSFGGQASSWSCTTLYAIAKEFLQQANKIFHIDWHTGIGAYGKSHFILDEAKDSEAFRLLSDWWPDHAIHCDDVVDGVSISYNGTLVVGLHHEISTFSSADVVNLTIEWGTFEVEMMLQALVMDNWLAHRAADAAPEHVASIRTQLIERFYPHALEWRRDVLTASEAIYAQAISGLENWDRG